MRHPKTTIAPLLAAALVACGGDGQPAAPTPRDETPAPTQPPADPAAPPNEEIAYVDGSATVRTTGDVETSFEAPIEEAPSLVDNRYLPERAEFQVSWANEQRRQLLITGTFQEGVPGGLDFFVAVRTGEGDAQYFPDSFHTQCEVALGSFTAEGFAGSFDCTDLESFDGSQHIDASGTFQASPAAAS